MNKISPIGCRHQDAPRILRVITIDNAVGNNDAVIASPALERLMRAHTDWTFSNCDAVEGTKKVVG